MRKIPSERATNEDSNWPVHPCSLISLCCQHEKTFAIKKVPSEDSANAQSDQNLHWANMSKGMMLRLICSSKYLLVNEVTRLDKVKSA